MLQLLHNFVAKFHICNHFAMIFGTQTWYDICYLWNRLTFCHMRFYDSSTYLQTLYCLDTHLFGCRYSNIITGQFFGHTHYDQYDLFYDPVTSRPVSVGYISPAVTTYREMNPSYRIYVVDGFYKNSTWVSAGQLYLQSSDQGTAVYVLLKFTELNFGASCDLKCEN